jgi:hypothetical protein
MNDPAGLASPYVLEEYPRSKGAPRCEDSSPSRPRDRETPGRGSYLSPHPVPTLAGHCMDRHASRQHHALLRVLTHIKKLDDCFGQFLMRVSCVCGASDFRSPSSWSIQVPSDPLSSSDAAL